MKRQMAEKDLIREVLSGDTDLFGELVATHQKRIFRMISCIADNREDAAEMTQETFILAFRGLASFRGESTFYTWLYRIAINVAFRAATKKRRLQLPIAVDAENNEDTMCDQTLTLSVSPLQFLEEKELLAAIEQALDTMPPPLRSVLSLRLIDDLSYTDIAEIEAIPVNTVRTRLWRARSQLAAKLEVSGGWQCTRGGS